MTRKTINKKTKGAVAAVAAGGLLLTTGGTFAFWQAQATLPGGEVTTGSLGLSAELTAPWAYTHEDASTAAADDWTPITEVSDGYLMVPGHTVRADIAVTAELDGTELIARLTIGEAGGTIASGIPGSVVTWQRWDPASGDFVDLPTVSTTADVITLDEDLRANQTYEFRVEIELPYDDRVDNRSNSYGRVDADGAPDPVQWTLDDAQILLTQQHPNTF